MKFTNKDLSLFFVQKILLIFFVFGIIKLGDNMKNNFILGIFIIFLLFNMYFAAENDYNDRKYTISINGNEIGYKLNEKYVFNTVPIFVHVKNWKNTYIDNSDHTSLMNIYLSKPTLEFNAVECFNTYNQKRSSCSVATSHTGVRKSDVTPYKMVIQHKDEVIYNGDYTTDLSNIIKETGRYYFNLYIKKSDKFLEHISTEIAFQVKFVGDKND